MANNSVRLDLIENGTSTGSAFTWPGGKGNFFVEGTFNGATVKLQYQTPNGTWVDLGSAVSMTANGQGEFSFPAGQVRAAVDGSPTGVYAYAIRI